MKQKFSLRFLLLFCFGLGLYSNVTAEVQTTFTQNSNVISVKIKPDQSYSNVALSAFHLTVRYLASYNVTFAVTNSYYSPVNYLGSSPDPTDPSYQLADFDFVITSAPTSFISGNEYTVFDFSVTGGEGIGSFSLSEDSPFYQYAYFYFEFDQYNDVTNYIDPFYNLVVTTNVIGLNTWKYATGQVIFGKYWLPTAASTDWNTAANWSDVVIPTLADNVTIPVSNNYPVIDVPDAVCKKMLIGSGALVTISPEGALTVDGDLTISDPNSLLIESSIDGSGSLIPNGAVSGTSEVQQYITADKYHEISSPISDGLSGVFDNPNGSEIFVWLLKFQESDGIFYTIEGTNVPLTVGQGYSAFADGDLLGSYDHALVSFSGQLNVDDVALNLSYTTPNPVPAATGFNLVGNPYQSALVAGIDTWFKSSLDNAVWVKQSNSGNYYFWNGTNGSLPDGVIPAKQGFWVKANDVNPTLIIPKTSRTHSTHDFYKDALTNNLRIHVTGSNEKADDAIIWFNSSADVLKDHILDVDKFFGDEDAPQLYFPVGSSNLSLNALPSIEQSYMVPMNFKCGVGGTFSIAVSDIGTFDYNTPILLEDMKTNQVMDLRNSANYSFDYSVGEPETRFRVFFKDAAGIDNIESGFVLSTTGKEIIINNTTGKSGQVYVYTVLGQLIKQTQLNSNGQTQISGIQQNGNFVVKIVSGSVNFTQKVYLN